MTERIDLFVEGSTDTPLATDRMNELVAVCNLFLSLRVGEGLHLTRSDAGFLLELTAPPPPRFGAGGDTTSTVPAALQQTL